LDDLRITPDYPALLDVLEKCELKSVLQEVKAEAARIPSALQGDLLF
jgi:hypothetical protein